MRISPRPSVPIITTCSAEPNPGLSAQMGAERAPGQRRPMTIPPAAITMNNEGLKGMTATYSLSPQFWTNRNASWRGQCNRPHK